MAKKKITKQTEGVATLTGHVIDQEILMNNFPSHPPHAEALAAKNEEAKTMLSTDEGANDKLNEDAYL